MKMIVLGHKEINLVEQTATRLAQFYYDLSQPWEFDDGYDTHEEAMEAAKLSFAESIVSGKVFELLEDLDDYEDVLDSPESDEDVRLLGEWCALRTMLTELTKTYF